MDFEPARSLVSFLLAGQLRRDFIVLPNGEMRMDVPGGNLLYAAAGLAIWETPAACGLVARVGEDYPEVWLEKIAQHGFDTRGIHRLPHSVDLRSFYAYPDLTSRPIDNPISFFASVDTAFPRVLYGYPDRSGMPDSRTRLAPTSIRQVDFLDEFLDATAAHICPLDYLTHNLIPAVLRQAGFTLVTLDPSPGYMNPSFRSDLPALITGLTAFFPSEEEMRSVFQGYTSDLWEMAELLAGFGCEYVVIKRGQNGQLLFDSSSRTRWEIPAYPIQAVDPTGAGDAFCGGFLAGYRRTYDPLLATLHGNISASLALEGHGPFYGLEALPGLAQARLEALRQSVRRV
jgi:cytidine kinase